MRPLNAPSHLGVSGGIEIPLQNSHAGIVGRMGLAGKNKRQLPVEASRGHFIANHLHECVEKDILPDT